MTPILPNDLRSRFQRRVEKTADCWLWLGATNDKGYGLIGSGRRGRLLYVHRLAWEWANNQTLAAGLEVCHRCDTPHCVRPSHLFIGTHAENMSDMARKGRSGVAVLNPQTVRHIVALRRQGVRRKEIARRLGVNINTLKDVLSGKNWRHITGWG